MGFIRSVFTWSSFSLWVVVVLVLSVAAAYCFTSYVDQFSGGPTEVQNVASLQEKEWTLIAIKYATGRDNIPVRAEDFTLQFSADKKFSGTTDCNSIFGSYNSGRRVLSLFDIGMTKKYCAWSQEQEYINNLGKVIGYYFNEKGELILELEFQSGIIVYR